VVVVVVVAGLQSSGLAMGQAGNPAAAAAAVLVFFLVWCLEAGRQAVEAG